MSLGQWVRETYVNSENAGATKTMFARYWGGLDPTVHNWAVVDDGCGMTPAEMEQYFGNRGGSSKPTGGVHDNFGQGAKISLLGWNPRGVVVISWTNRHQTPQMLMLRREDDEFVLVERQGQYVYPVYVDPDTGNDWTKARQGYNRNHGTVIVLLGSPDRPSTWVASQRHEQVGMISGQTILTYLKQRLLHLSCPVHVQVSASAKTPMIQAISAGEHLANAQSSGTVELSHGTRVDWYLADVDDLQDFHAFVAPVYQGEVYRFEGQAGGNRENLFYQFGIPPGAARRAITLLVYPPMYDEQTETGVFSETMRHGLFYRHPSRKADDLSLPWAEWGKEFNEQLPVELRHAIDRLQADRRRLTINAKFLERLKDRLRHLGSPAVRRRVTVQVPKPREKRTDTDGNRVDDGNRGNGGGHGTTRTRTRTTVPKTVMEWVQRPIIPGSRTSSPDDNFPEWLVALYDIRQKVVVLHTGSKYIQNEIEYHLDQYVNPTTDVYNAVSNAVFSHYLEKAISIVGCWYSMAATVASDSSEEYPIDLFMGGENPTREGGPLSPVALSVALMGFVNDETAIKRRLNAMQVGVRAAVKKGK